VASGAYSVLPWVTMVVAANAAGWMADAAIARGQSVTRVRKVAQTIGFLGPAFFLTQLGHVHTAVGAVSCMMAAQGLDAFSQVGRGGGGGRARGPGGRPGPPPPTPRARRPPPAPRARAGAPPLQPPSNHHPPRAPPPPSQAGLYSNHADIGPRYAGVLLGLSNTAGVLAGVLGTAATGYILREGSWDDVWAVAVGLYLVGTVVWNLFATGERIFD